MEPTKNRASGTTPPPAGVQGHRAGASDGAAGDLVGEAKGVATQAADRARDLAKEQLAEHGKKSAGEIGNVARALHRTSADLGDSMAAPLVRRAAGLLDEVSDTLRAGDVRQVVRSTERFARREPLLFIGGAFALGLLAARFLKSSERRHEDEADHLYGGSQYGGNQYDERGAYALHRDPYQTQPVTPSREVVVTATTVTTPVSTPVTPASPVATPVSPVTPGSGYGGPGDLYGGTRRS